MHGHFCRFFWVRLHVGMAIGRNTAVRDLCHVEKPLHDAFRPVNATISAVIAAASAFGMEAVRTGLAQDISALLGEPEEEPEEETEPMDLKLVAVNASQMFIKDTTGSSLQRAAEHLAVSRVSEPTYMEMLKHLPRCAKHVYQQNCGRGGAGA